MTEIDFKKTMPSYQASTKIWREIEIPKMHYIMIDGEGDPNTSPIYKDSIETLYPVSYALKFHSKNALGKNYVVPPLEGLWWADDMSVFLNARSKDKWKWTMMMFVPDWLSQSDVEAAIAATKAKGKAPRIDALRYEPLDEGLVLQRMHIGPYDAEGPKLKELHNEIVPERGLKLAKKHHEIYIGDPRRAKPENLKTILRQPVAHA